MKRIMLILSCLFLSFNSISCDLCGCAPGNNTIGLTPNFKKHLLGIRYSYNAFDSKPHDGEQGGDTRELFHQFQLWGRITFFKRLQLHAFLPYKVNRRFKDSKIYEISNFGDASFLFQALILDPTKSKRKFTQTLQAGFGVKLPTGKYDQIDDGIMIHQNIQSGTGSIDWQANAQYTFRYNKIGIFSEMMYTLAGANPMGFKFGNRTSTWLKAVAWLEQKSYTILPQIGIGYESIRPDQLSRVDQEFTGGKSLLAATGIDFYYKKTGLMLHYQIPIKQQLGDGNISSSPRLSANLIYQF
jgi:hypothetical protein